MNKREMKLYLMLFSGLLLLSGGMQRAMSQEYRWLRVGQAETFVVDYGCESEFGAVQSNYFSWPSQYGENQYMTRGKGMWLGAKNFYDPVEKKVKSVKVIGAGPRIDQSIQQTMTIPLSIKLIGKSYPPKVFVDGQIGSNNTLYDVLDEQDDRLPCDRMVVVQTNTSMGISVTEKVLAFTQPNHENYFIHDYVFKNTGIYNKAGDVSPQTLNDFWVNFMYRYAFSGVTSTGWGSTWGAFSSEWGASTVYGDFGPYRNPQDSLRGFYAYYGPNKERTSVTYDQDWGCPNQNGGGPLLDGVLGSAKFSGVVTLFASQGPGALSGTNDPNQPMSTSYFNSDDNIMQSTVSQYDESLMLQRYKRMTEGHLPQSHEQSVGDQYIADWRSAFPERDGGGGSSQGQGFGPYTLAPGDSIRIVFAEGCNGISWEKCREIGNVWYQYFKGLPSPPPLVYPANYSGPTASYTDYTKAWVKTGKDSILQTLRSALKNFQSGYTLPQAPPAPDQFTVTSGGDRINLQWSSNADGAPHFDGYVIWRAEGSVKDYRTVYTKIFECNKANVVHEWNDTSAGRGFNYYYAIQSKDDGSQNEVKPGVPLTSSLMLTLTTVPAHLLRPAGNLLGEVRVVPNPYDIRARAYQFGDQFQYDRITFYGIPPNCKLKIFTENGTLIWEKNHTNGSGDEIWDSKTSSGQVVVSGVYILYVEVAEDIFATEDKIAKYDVFDENLNKMYAQGQKMFSRGEKLFSAGQSTFRKFMVIR